jgi:hypothetical protein
MVNFMPRKKSLGVFDRLSKNNAGVNAGKTILARVNSGSLSVERLKSIA